MKELLVSGFICACGLLMHFSMKWAEHRRDVEKVGLWPFLQLFPAQHLVSAVATVAAFTVTFTMEWMNPGMALACGYMGNSVAENLAKRFMSDAK